MRWWAIVIGWILERVFGVSEKMFRKRDDD